MHVLYYQLPLFKYLINYMSHLYYKGIHVKQSQLLFIRVYSHISTKYAGLYHMHTTCQPLDYFVHI